MIPARASNLHPLAKPDGPAVHESPHARSMMSIGCCSRRRFRQLLPLCSGTFLQRSNSYFKSNLLEASFVLCFDQVHARGFFPQRAHITWHHSCEERCDVCGTDFPGSARLT